MAERLNLRLGVGLGAQIEEVHQRPQAEADDEVLPVVERQDAPRVLFGVALPNQLPIAVGRGRAEAQVPVAIGLAVGVGLALPIAVLAHRPEVEHGLQGLDGAQVRRATDAVAGVAHGLDVEAHPHPMGAGLLHHPMGEEAHVEDDLGMFQGPVVAALAGEQPLDADLPSAGLIGPLQPVGRHEPLAVVLVHGHPAGFLRVGRGGDQLDAEQRILDGCAHAGCSSRAMARLRRWAGPRVQARSAARSSRAAIRSESSVQA